VRVHLLPAFGERPVTELTWKVIEDFIAAKRATGSIRHPGKSLRDVTLRAVLLPLRLILQYAVRCRYIPANPMHEVEWKPERHHETVDPFTPVELRAILAAARDVDTDLAVMLELWMRTGARAGEVMGLQNHDLDPQAGTVLIRRTWTRHRLGSTKTGRERTVSFLHPVCENTPEWRPQGDGHALLAKLRVRSTEPEAFVFIRNGQPWGSKTLNFAWRRVLTKARVRYRPPEQLRHTFASTMLSRNAPPLDAPGRRPGARTGSAVTPQARPAVLR
jgi:integrase